MDENDMHNYAESKSLQVSAMRVVLDDKSYQLLIEVTRSLQIDITFIVKLLSRK